MKNKTRLIVTESLMFLAFAYAAEKMDPASAACAVLSALLAADGIRIRHFFRLVPEILAAALLQLVLAHFSGLYEEIPVIGVLILCNTVTAVMHAQRQTRPAEADLKPITLTALAFYTAAMILPDQRFAAGMTLLYVSLIFLPLYACRLLALGKEQLKTGTLFTRMKP
ncbi:MAG: hypothetical protein K6A40_12035 [Solobacterium sp.]|nr:hypothetical protein [Solobacterium sp.]